MDSYTTMPDAQSTETLLCLGKQWPPRARFIDPDEAALAAEALNAVIDAPVMLGPVEMDEEEAFAAEAVR